MLFSSSMILYVNFSIILKIFSVISSFLLLSMFASIMVRSWLNQHLCSPYQHVLLRAFLHCFTDVTCTDFLCSMNLFKLWKTFSQRLHLKIANPFSSYTIFHAYTQPTWRDPPFLTTWTIWFPEWLQTVLRTFLTFSHLQSMFLY